MPRFLKRSNKGSISGSSGQESNYLVTVDEEQEENTFVEDLNLKFDHFEINDSESRSTIKDEENEYSINNKHTSSVVSK